MKKCLHVREELYDANQLEELDKVCRDFQSYSRSVTGILRGMIKDISNFMNVKNQSIQDYKIFLSMLDKYEDLNLDNYVEGDPTKMVFGNTEFKEEKNIKEQVSVMCDSLRNPYFNLYHWAKGELMDIKSIQLALSTKDKMSDNILKNEKKKVATREDLDNVKLGKKTIKTLFKNKDDANRMEQGIENVS
jgi:hypothetical protein